MTLDELRAWGADVDDGLARCMGQEDSYLRIVGHAVHGDDFEKMDSLYAAGDWDAAFSAAHNLKGTTGNLSLTPLYEPLCEVADILRPETRDGEPEDCTELLATIRERRAQLLAR